MRGFLVLIRTVTDCVQHDYHGIGDISICLTVILCDLTNYLKQ